MNQHLDWGALDATEINVAPGVDGVILAAPSQVMLRISPTCNLSCRGPSRKFKNTVGTFRRGVVVHTQPQLGASQNPRVVAATNAS